MPVIPATYEADQPELYTEILSHKPGGEKETQRTTSNKFGYNIKVAQHMRHISNSPSSEMMQTA